MYIGLSVYFPYLFVYMFCQMSFIYYLFFSQHWEIVQDSGSWPALNEATSSHPPPPPPPATKESPQQKEQKKVSHSLSLALGATAAAGCVKCCNKTMENRKCYDNTLRHYVLIITCS